jgi:hypothetical protein
MEFGKIFVIAVSGGIWKEAIVKLKIPAFVWKN